jgi:hypothetical protein
VNNIELLHLIREEYYRIKPEKCFEFFEKRDRIIPCLPILKKRFGKTYNGILIMAGVKDDDLNLVRRNKEEYLNKLKEVTSKLGYVPSCNEFLALGYTPRIIKKYFGSYANAVKELNYQEYKYKTPVKVNESKQELLEMYIDYSKKIGKPASCLDLEKSNEIYNPGVFTIRFGSMNNLKKEAGFQIIYGNSEIYSKEDIRNKLIELHKKKGGRLTIKEIKAENELPGLITILSKFNTTKILDVWEEIESSIEKSC